MQMESYESFMCRCEGGDVVLRQSHKPHSFGKLYYACPRSKPSQKNNGCGYFKWKDEITFGNTSSFSGPKTPSNSSSRASSSSGSSRAALSPGNTECPNCKLLTKNIKILEARLAMEKNPDDHPLLRESAQSNNWEDVLVLYCWRAKEEDLKVARSVFLIKENGAVHLQDFPKGRTNMESAAFERCHLNPYILDYQIRSLCQLLRTQSHTRKKARYSLSAARFTTRSDATISLPSPARYGSFLRIQLMILFHLCLKDLSVVN
uniref:GRF-type domain-containing protein n=1 Tax=Tanacetum cinerariifolium TaxID=118510 RepID=A0A6L2M2R5_TANCI|nr:hypothetical protein [Tanacetum cinerariifolium]